MNLGAQRTGGIAWALAILLLAPLINTPTTLLARVRHVTPLSNVPLPPPRPPDFTPVPTPAEQTPAPDVACAGVLTGNHDIAEAMPPVSGPGGCGIAAPVKLEKIVLADKTQIPLEPAPLIRCALAAALVDWFHDDVVPLAQKSGGLAKILASNGYECRPRNSIVGGKLSEHAKGNALDLRGFVMRNGQTIMLDQQTAARDFFAPLKTSACTRFTTVLGPGADSFHEHHLHVDLMERQNHYRICQWDVK